MDTIRYKFNVSYDGTHFAGFQIQPNGRTVQGEIEKALKRMSKGQSVRLRSAGRTDAGVHAKGQVIHFDYPKFIPAASMQKGLNTLITNEILLWDPEIVSKDFHAQYSATDKKYEYRVYNGKLRDPFIRNTTLHHPYEMNLEAVQIALRTIEGTHDFTSFSSAKTDKENKVRTIYKAAVRIDSDTNEWIFTFSGDGFLYHMIRIIMGTLLEIADGRRKPEEMSEILAAKDRQAGGPTAAPNGLCLMSVSYDD